MPIASHDVKALSCLCRIYRGVDADLKLSQAGVVLGAFMDEYNDIAFKRASGGDAAQHFRKIENRLAHHFTASLLPEAQRKLPHASRDFLVLAYNDCPYDSALGKALEPLDHPAPR